MQDRKAQVRQGSWTYEKKRKRWQEFIRKVKKGDKNIKEKEEDKRTERIIRNAGEKSSDVDVI
jgi:hypothetical protein